MKYRRIIISIIFSLTLLFSYQTFAQNNHLLLSAKGVAIYGWIKGKPHPLYVKNPSKLFPIASLTKLVTAKIVLKTYSREALFTISQNASDTPGDGAVLPAGGIFSRDDLLASILIASNNDATVSFAEALGWQAFMDKLNNFLSTRNYAVTKFINPAGLDPSKNYLPNRMTPYNLSRLINNIYNNDQFLVNLLSQESKTITDRNSNTNIVIQNTNDLMRDPLYKDKIIISKTGFTNLAGQNLVFITKGFEKYEYVTVVLLGSKDRTADAKAVLDWLEEKKSL